MAVIDDPARIQYLVLGGRGTVEITERCVYLNLMDKGHPGRKLLLVWLSGNAQWDPEGHAVVFTSSEQGTRRIREGDFIEVGGVDLVEFRHPDWLVPPDRSCSGRRWLVDSFDKVNTD